MSLTAQFAENVRACFAGIWIETFEPDEALREIAELCRNEEWSLATWDVERGLRAVGAGVSEDMEGSNHQVATTDPIAAIQSANVLASDDRAGVLVLQNFHRLLGSLEVIQAMSRQIGLGKQNRTFLVVLAPVVQNSRRAGEAVRGRPARAAGSRSAADDCRGSRNGRRRTAGQ